MIPLRRRRRPAAVLPAGARVVCFLLVWIPPLALALAGGRALVARTDALLDRAKPLLVAEATRALDREVRIGTLSPDLSVAVILRLASRLSSLGTLPVVIGDTAIANGRTFAESGTLATARRTTLFVSVPALLSGDVSRAIPRVVVEDPDVLLVRNANGRFNVQELVRPRRKPAGKPFRTRVVVQDGRLRFRDFAAALRGDGRRLPAENYLSRVNGEVDLSGTRAVRFDAAARARPGTATERRLGGGLFVSGSVPRARPGAAPGALPGDAARALVSLRAEAADAPYWFDYLFDVRAFRITSGTADVDVGLAFPQAPPRAGAPAPPVVFSGVLRARNARITAERLPAPLERVNGTLGFSRNALRVDATGTLWGERVDASGALWNLLRSRPGAPAPDPGLALRLRMPRLPAATAARSLFARYGGARATPPVGLRFSGTGSAEATVRGSFAAPVVTGTAAFPEVVYRGNRIENVRADLRYAAGTVSATSVTARAAGGTVSGAAEIRLLPAARPGGRFRAALSGVDLGQLRTSGAAGALPSARGRGDVDVVGSFDERGVTAAAANVSLREASFRGVRVATGRGRILYEGGRFLVPALAADTSAGMARIGGSVTPGGGLDLRYRLLGLNLADVARAAGRPGAAAGLAYASGTVTGSLRDPRLAVNDFRVLGPTFGAFRADVVSGSLIATRRRITLGDDVVVRRFPGSARVSGSVTGLNTKAPRLDLVARARNLDLSDLARAVSAAGGGSARAAGADVRDTRRRGGAAAVPADLAGVVERATVRVTGTTAAPQFAAAADLRRMAFGDVAVDVASLRFAYRNGTAVLESARLRSPWGEVTAAATLDSRGRVSGTFAAPVVVLERLLPFGRGGVAVEGAAAVTGSVSGTRKRPVVEAQVSAPALRVAGAPIQDLRAGVRVAADADAGTLRVTAPLISLRQDETRLDAVGTFWERQTGRVGTTVSLRDGDIAALLNVFRRTPFAGTEPGRKIVERIDALPQPLAGRLDVLDLSVVARLAAAAGGGVRDLRVGAPDIRGTEIRLGQLVADTFRAAGSFAGGVVTLDTFRLVNQASETTIQASGTRGRSSARIDLNGEVDLLLDASNASLALVRLFAPALQARGRMESLTLTATGPFRTPTVTLDFFGRSSPEEPLAFGTAADDPNGAGRTVGVRLVRGLAELRPVAPGSTRGRITIPEGAPIEVRRDELHAITVTGDVPFSYETLQIPRDEPIRLAAVAPPQSLDLITALAPQLRREDIGGTIEGSLGVTGTLDDPRLSGGLSITGARLASRAIEGLVAGDPSPAPVPGVDRPTPPASPPPSPRRGQVNSIARLDLTLGFEGRTITVRPLRLALGGPNGETEGFGALEITGTVNGVGVGPSEPGRGPNLRGQLDLTAALRDLRPVWNNVLDRGEVARARVNGEIRVAGPLPAPRLFTPEGSAVKIADALLEPPTRDPRPASGGPPVLRPRFDLAFDVEPRAVLAVPGRFRLEAAGNINLRGTLTDPNFQGSLEALGGYVQLPTARFVVQRGGDILLFRPAGPSSGRPESSLGSGDEQLVAIRVNDLVALATVYAPAGVTPSLGIRASQGVLGTPTPRATGRSARYRITAQFNGLLNATNPEDLRLSVSSDPALSESQILALIGTKGQIETALSGDVNRALVAGFTQALSSSVVPGLLSGVEQGLATAFGLEEFSLEYAPDAPLTLSLLKRFPDPFERFLVSYTRSVQTRNAPGVPEPYTLRLLYEIGPRLQLGVTTDERRDTTFLLRGTLTY